MCRSRVLDCRLDQRQVTDRSVVFGPGRVLRALAPQPTSRRSSAWNRQPMLHIASCRLLTKRADLTEIRLSSDSPMSLHPRSNPTETQATPSGAATYTRSVAAQMRGRDDALSAASAPVARNRHNARCLPPRLLTPPEAAQAGAVFAPSHAGALYFSPVPSRSGDGVDRLVNDGPRGRMEANHGAGHHHGTS